MDKFSAEDAFDCQSILQGLADEALCKAVIGDMTEEIKLVAEEPEEVTRKWKYLEGRKYILESDHNTFRSALEFLSTGI